MENVEQRYPITMAVLRNAIDRIAGWKNVTPQAKTRKQVEIAVVIVALSNTLVNVLEKKKQTLKGKANNEEIYIWKKRGDNHDTLDCCHRKFNFKSHRMLFNAKKKSPFMLGYILSFSILCSIQCTWQYFWIACDN